MQDFKIQCEHCEKDTSFTVSEVADLDDYIDRCESEEYARGKEDGIDEASQNDTGIDRNLFYDIALAIRAGDTANAEHLIDKLADELGGEYPEFVQRGRYNSQTRKAA